MPRRRIMKIGGKDVSTIEVDFEIVREEWNEYKLLDGGIVRVKTTPIRISRILEPDGNPAVTKDGDPHLNVQHTTYIVSRED